MGRCLEHVLAAERAGEFVEPLLVKAAPTELRPRQRS